MTNPRVQFTPSSTLYPFTSRWFDTSAGRMHYLDEGTGPPILLLHGNPDWSFLYRRIIVGLRKRFRCIAPDYLGFGLSDHPPGYQYTPAEHAACVAELVDHLGLEQMVVFGQDWGGPIGMWVASHSPQRVSGLVMANTWYSPTRGGMPWIFSKALGSPPMQSWILRGNFFVERLMVAAIQANVEPGVLDHYRATTPSPAFRRGVAEFPKQITASRQWLSSLERDARQELRDKPFLLMFGRKDPLLASDKIIRQWCEDFPNHRFIEFAKAGHYVQEDVPDEIIAAVKQIFG